MARMRAGRGRGGEGLLGCARMHARLRIRATPAVWCLHWAWGGGRGATALGAPMAQASSCAHATVHTPLWYDVTVCTRAPQVFASTPPDQRPPWHRPPHVHTPLCTRHCVTTLCAPAPPRCLPARPPTSALSAGCSPRPARAQPRMRRAWWTSPRGCGFKL